ncbi:MAG: AbrB/MazE/SpoVT family DNA-binding domain-containing protein [Caldilineaceae bacterium]
MAASLKTRIIRIGNSQGIRIPKVLMQQLGFVDEVELEAQDGQLVVRPLQTARQGWAEQFLQMAAGGDDQLLNEDFPLTDWATTEN